MPRLIAWLLATLLILCGGWGAGPALASLSDDRYDGNIYALYAGNGSLVPPRTTLAEAREAGRVVVLVYYLDDSAVSKQFAPVVSELQRLWGKAVELLPLVTDPLQNRNDQGPSDPAHYWNGTIPQVVVLDPSGTVRFDASGAVDVDAINAAVSAVTGIPLPEGGSLSSTVSFNELNSEVVARSR